MPKNYSIAEARDHLPALVHDAEKGDAIQLTRRGKPVAVLISTRDYDRLTQGKRDFWASLQDFRQRHELTDMDVDEIFADVRDRSPGRKVEW